MNSQRGQAVVEALLAFLILIILANGIFWLEWRSWQKQLNTIQKSLTSRSMYRNDPEKKL